VTALLAAGLTAAISLARPALVAESPLDHVLSAYQSGDRDVVARTFRGSIDFHALRMPDERRITRWLGSWQRDKAAFLLELANASGLNAPAYTLPLLIAGQRYVVTRPGSRARSAADDEFELLWHRVALGILERGRFFPQAPRYLAALRTLSGTSSSDVTSDPHLLLGRAIVEEQRCWNGRPTLGRAGAPVADVIRASAGRRGNGELPPDWTGAMGVIAMKSEEHRQCLLEVLARLDASARHEETSAEVRVRRAWSLFQLDRVSEALTAIDGVDPGDDRDLAYWASLFRARIADALGRDVDAEAAYRTALEIAPGAQTAGVGLAFQLFRLNRFAEAEDVAVAVRNVSAATEDPWWSYLNADGRFIERWIAQLRKALP
jgi:hypothetical protein